ncbi:MAG: type IV secretory system conjugative DNA transfer family protein [Chloroflexota bacterium]
MGHAAGKVGNYSDICLISGRPGDYYPVLHLIRLALFRISRRCHGPGRLDRLAIAMMQPDLNPNGDDFWKQSEVQLRAALFAHAVNLPVPTPATVYDLLDLSPTDLLTLLRTSPVRQARRYANTLGDMKPEAYTGVVLMVNNKLAFMHDPTVRRFTSASLRSPDFGLLTDDPTRPIAVYWVLHERDTSLLQPLSSLLFTLLLEDLSRGSVGNAPVTLLLDEFATIGRIPDFSTTITVVRDLHIHLVLGIQALSQLEGLYGKPAADTIRNNCGTKVALHGLDYHSAEEVSKALGEMTIQQEVQSRHPEGWRSNTYSYSEQHIQRRLLTADEARRIGQDEALIIVTNRRPIRSKRYFWKEPPKTATAGSLGPQQSMKTPQPTRRNDHRDVRPDLDDLDDELAGES